MEQTLGVDDLRLVVAIGTAGSLAGAARAMGISHASAWRRLGALETRLGVRLFDRSRTGYLPTPTGEETIAGAEEALRALDELGRRIAGRDIRPAGIVRVTTTETLVELLVPVLVRLRETHPGIVVELVIDNAFFTLTRRDADIALRPAREAPEGLVARRLGDVPSAVYASRAYLDRCGTADPLAMDWLAPDDSLAHLGSARWIAANVAPERIVHRTNSLNALRAAARAELGLAPLPRYLTNGAGDLVEVLPPIAEMTTSLWLITHPDLRRTARVRAVIDEISRLAGVLRER